MTLPLLSQISRTDRHLVGGKAANLGEVASLGLRVPIGFVIPTRFGDSFLKRRASLQSPAAFSSADAQESSLAIHESLANIPLDFVLEREILHYFEVLGLGSVSVRSSATIEDSADLSFAGVFESILNVRKDDVISAVKRCWLSTLAPRVRNYCIRHGLSDTNIHMAVIVQELVEPLVAGICFTSHPITGDANYMLVEAAWGFGDLIVSGRITPDSYLYHWPSRTLTEMTINSQEIARLLVNGALSDVPVEEAKRAAQKLSDELLHELTQACKAIVDHNGRPQDIEFAVSQNTICFLQSRPITTQQ